MTTSILQLAKYLNAWEGLPDVVCLGAEKNFSRFIRGKVFEVENLKIVSVETNYPNLAAISILFKETQKIVRSLIQDYQYIVTVYTVSLISKKLGGRINLDRVISQKTLSGELLSQIEIWVCEVSDVLRRTADVLVLSEWSRMPECREAVLSWKYSAHSTNIPEVH